MPRNPYYQGPTTDHFDGVRFFNPGQPSIDRGVSAILRWKLAGGAATWPTSIPVNPVKPEKRIAGLRVTMVGHATLLIQSAGINILTDPVWSERASPFGSIGPKRVTAPGIAFDDLPPIDVVLLSHCHYDHMDIATLRRLQAAHAPLMAMPLGNDAIVRAAVPGVRCKAGDWWDRLILGEGLSTTLTPAYHWGNRWPTDVRMSLWSGHFIDTVAGTIWFVGDTGYGKGAIFKQVRQHMGAPDVALIPIGAYEPRWFMSAQHIDPAEAISIFQDVEARHALGIHWGTFQLTDEAWEAPRLALTAALSASSIPPLRFVAATPGAIYDFHTALVG